MRSLSLFSMRSVLTAVGGDRFIGQYKTEATANVVAR